MEQEILQLGGMFAISYALIELIKFIINKFVKNGNSKSGEETNSAAILSELKAMNGNHLIHVQQAISEGNKEIVKAINDMHFDLLKELNKKVL